MSYDNFPQVKYWVLVSGAGYYARHVQVRGVFEKEGDAEKAEKKLIVKWLKEEFNENFSGLSKAKKKLYPMYWTEINKMILGETVEEKERDIP